MTTSTEPLAIEKLYTEMQKWQAQSIDLIVHKVGKIDQVLEEQRRQRETLEKLADAIGRLAVVEERQTNDRKDMQELRAAIGDMSAAHSKGMERVMTAVESVEARLIELEKLEVHNGRVRGIFWGALAVFGASMIGFLMFKLGLKPA